MFGIQPLHLIIVAVVALLLIFGPSRLPEIGRSFGKMLIEFRNGAKDMAEGFKEEIKKPVEPSNETVAPPAISQPMPQSVPQPLESDKNLCVHCGNNNLAGAVFCNKCGNKITQ